MTKIYDAANWSKHEDDFTQMFYNQNVKQFWLPEEIALNGDLLTWKYLGKNEQDTYMKVLAGLTLLDTEQGNTGMPIVAEHVDTLTELTKRLEEDLTQAMGDEIDELQFELDAAKHSLKK